MALDDFQRRQRQRYLGSSDAPALAGVDPFGRNQVDVWLEKTGKLQPAKYREDLNSPKVVGTYLESGILSWVEDSLGVRLARDQFKIHSNGVMAANFDGLALAASPPAVVEAKVCGMFGLPKYFDEFGDAFTDEVPDHVRIQTQHQLAVADAQSDFPRMDLVLVPVLLARRGFVLYRVPRSQDLCDAIVELEENFHDKYIKRDEQPPDTPSMESLKRLVRSASAPVEIDPADLLNWRKAKEQIKLAEEAEEQTRRVVLAALGDAERGICEAGGISYLEQTRKAYQVSESAFRVLRFSKPKP